MSETYEEDEEGYSNPEKERTVQKLNVLFSARCSFFKQDIWYELPLQSPTSVRLTISYIATSQKSLGALYTNSSETGAFVCTMNTLHRVHKRSSRNEVSFPLFYVRAMFSDFSIC